MECPSSSSCSSFRPTREWHQQTTAHAGILMSGFFRLGEVLGADPKDPCFLRTTMYLIEALQLVHIVLPDTLAKMTPPPSPSTPSTKQMMHRTLHNTALQVARSS